jgi:hypothetical protein
MTSETAGMDCRKANPWAFAGALILAPLTVGLPAVGLIWLATLTDSALAGLVMFAIFPAAATVLGAPTYLIFGGPALWFALRTNSSTAFTAFIANLISLPAVGAFSILTNGEVLGTMTLYAVLGSIFAPLWGAIFALLYEMFSGETLP